MCTPFSMRIPEKGTGLSGRRSLSLSVSHFNMRPFLKEGTGAWQGRTREVSCLFQYAALFKRRDGTLVFLGSDDLDEFQYAPPLEKRDGSSAGRRTRAISAFQYASFLSWKDVRVT